MNKFENNNYSIETHMTEASQGNDLIKLQAYKAYDKKTHKGYELLIKNKQDQNATTATLPNVEVLLKETSLDENGVMSVSDTAHMQSLMPKEFNSQLGTIDGLMAVYHKASESKEKSGQKVKDFFDNYIFNTDESREVLHEYLNKKKNSQMQINSSFLKNRSR